MATKYEFSKDTDNTTNGVLAKLWKKIVLENNLQDKLIYFIGKYDRRTDLSKKKTKGVVIKHALTDKAMTWKTFLFLLFEVLRVKKIKLTIELDWGKRKTVHEMEILPETTEEDRKEEDKK